MNMQDFIPREEKKPRKVVARYQKPESVKRLEKDYFEFKYRNSSIPENCRFVKKFRDDTANGLTECLSIWSKINGAFYQRQNSQGQYDARLKMWRKSGSTKGIADVQVTHNGKVYNFEIKIGRDKQSDIQKQVQAQIIAAGGHYAVVKCYDDFLKELHSLHTIKKSI
ncbi:hypothetical protein [Parabacteroides sp. PF5-9]|uniref:hypothetical protein n=1 Tax=Parabacteroides sp. PF5-9 TaxID=1742404 RepID=UPI0024746909|nr:hypothetical protein [Parabacteroides sp. PF5-9]MDH6356258.1 hypothetical protein [Parabacteroides sp. PF5-9]